MIGVSYGEYGVIDDADDVGGGDGADAGEHGEHGGEHQSSEFGVSNLFLLICSYQLPGWYFALNDNDKYYEWQQTGGADSFQKNIMQPLGRDITATSQ